AVTTRISFDWTRPARPIGRWNRRTPNTAHRLGLVDDGGTALEIGDAVGVLEPLGEPVEAELPRGPRAAGQVGGGVRRALDVGRAQRRDVPERPQFVRGLFQRRSDSRA